VDRNELEKIRPIMRRSVRFCTAICFRRNCFRPLKIENPKFSRKRDSLAKTILIKQRIFQRVFMHTSRRSRIHDESHSVTGYLLSCMHILKSFFIDYCNDLITYSVLRLRGGLRLFRTGRPVSESGTLVFETFFPTSLKPFSTSRNCLGLQRSGKRLLRSEKPVSNWHASFGKWYNQFSKLGFPLLTSPEPFLEVKKGFREWEKQVRKLVEPRSETGMIALRSLQTTSDKSASQPLLRRLQTTSEKPARHF
jgi:hypothetical protein